MARAIYLSHPQVVIDPNVPVPQWGLNNIGRARVARLAASDALSGIRVIYASAEVKATETATPLAAALGCPMHVAAQMGENDRSATGFLSGPVFEQTANAFFANPDVSVSGWETANEAQSRMLAAVDDALSASPEQDVLFVGHGAVGTLLYCALAGLPIDRSHDQPFGGGNVYCFDTQTRQPDGPWRSLETLLA